MARSTGRSTDKAICLGGGQLSGRSMTQTVKNLTVGRSTGWSTDNPFCAGFDPQQLYFEEVKKGVLGVVFNKIFKAKILIFSSIFQQVLKVVYEPKVHIFILF